MNSLLFFIILIPALEIYVFIKVGNVFGAVSTILLIISTICDRNGTPLSGVVSAAENIANLMGPNLRNVQIVNRQFGGPTQTMGSQVGYRLTFNTPDGFATAMDTLRTNQPEQAGGLSCNVPSAWLIHRVYSRNN